MLGWASNKEPNKKTGCQIVLPDKYYKCFQPTYHFGCKSSLVELIKKPSDCMLGWVSSLLAVSERFDSSPPQEQVTQRGAGLLGAILRLPVANFVGSQAQFTQQM